MEYNENLENSKGKDKKERELYASLYYGALKRQIEEYDTGDSAQFEEMEEGILEEIDRKIEPHLEETRPDLIIKRIKGLQFLVIDRERCEKKIRDTDI